MAHLLLPLIASGWFVALPGHGLLCGSDLTHLVDPGSSETFDKERVEACLQAAGALIDANADFFEDARAWLDGAPVEFEPVDPFDLQRSPFGKFEGSWCGRWDGVPARHLWRSLDADTQLVFVEDGGAPGQGINLRSDDGTLCGIVRDAFGVERLHEGRLADPGGSELLWLTPDRTYLERVVHIEGVDHYEIRERLDNDSRDGVFATYLPCTLRST
jgi:hypothetical protein